ncbi:MAG TPA: helix-turn-helix domain-containing protein [Candidatus Deferrimicrobium sp.]|nr:helix-turn-helix domain-containing protein [Candidatus Deferrimicrobium sp.]
MRKIQKVLQLISLLSTRRSVSLQTIQDVLGFPRRTVFRYLTTLSEANIPVYYDKTVRAYRLAAPVHFPLDSLSLNETILVLCALKLLCRHVNPGYRSELDGLIKTIVTRHPLPMEDAVRSVEVPASPVSSLDYSDFITSLRIQAAILFDRKLTVSKSADVADSDRIEVRRPSVLFRQDWCLSGDANNGNRPTPVEQIAKVDVT